MNLTAKEVIKIRYNGVDADKKEEWTAIIVDAVLARGIVDIALGEENSIDFTYQDLDKNDINYMRVVCKDLRNRGFKVKADHWPAESKHKEKFDFHMLVEID